MVVAILENIEGCTYYLANIVIHSCNAEATYKAIFEKVLQQYRKHVLVVNCSKSKFDIHQTMFSTYVINSSKVQIDITKLRTMFK